MIEYLKTHMGDDSEMISKVIEVLLYFLLTEFVPDILSLDSSFLVTYYSEEETDIENTDNPVTGRVCEVYT